MCAHLKKELLTARKQVPQEKVLSEVAAILAEHEQRRLAILETLHGGNSDVVNALDFDLLESDRIFSLDNIKKVCIDYRLRFLESGRFKNGFPEEALAEIRKLENQHGTRLAHFKIMAPTKAFKLDNYDDPLLFVPIGNHYFYLVHQWGNDINPWRKWKVLPFRNLGWFTVFCVLLSLALTWMIPLNQLGKQVHMASVIVFLFLFKSVFAVAMYGFFMRGRSFSSSMWNSRFYNQ
ncbi:hypothetical protein [Flavobacterium sp.]|uniref:hypothetical protein n=1 Tax=Flavobacterium sp. TaxID=239 RepID=UPI0039E2372F